MLKFASAIFVLTSIFSHLAFADYRSADLEGLRRRGLGVLKEAHAVRPNAVYAKVISKLQEVNLYIVDGTSQATRDYCSVPRFAFVFHGDYHNIYFCQKYMYRISSYVGLATIIHEASHAAGWQNYVGSECDAEKIAISSMADYGFLVRPEMFTPKYLVECNLTMDFRITGKNSLIRNL